MTPSWRYCENWRHRNLYQKPRKPAWEFTGTSDHQLPVATVAAAYNIHNNIYSANVSTALLCCAVSPFNSFFIPPGLELPSYLIYITRGVLLCVRARYLCAALISYRLPVHAGLYYSARWLIIQHHTPITFIQGGRP
jgi:hypothetical protein